MWAKLCEKSVTDMLDMMSVSDNCVFDVPDVRGGTECVTHRRTVRRTKTRTKAWIKNCDGTSTLRWVLELGWQYVGRDLV